jgi:hypothetical protein
MTTTPSLQVDVSTPRRRMFVKGSGTSAWARRWRDLQSLYVNDIGPDESSLSEFQLGLCDTAATLRCELERMEGKLSLGETIDTDAYGRIAGHYRRIAATLGIERRSMRNITPPSVEAYLAHVNKTREAAERNRQ